MNARQFLFRNPDPRSNSMITHTRKSIRAPRRGASAVFAIAAFVAASAQAAVNSGSTGADGALNPTVNTQVVLPESGILNYTTVNIPAGVTVTFKKNTANTPVHILATGDVTVAGKIDITGGDAKASGTYGDGVLGDDGIPGVGGPGGFDGGRGGRDDTAQSPSIVRGGSGLGPGGGLGGIEGSDSCTATGWYKSIGIGGAYTSNVYQAHGNSQCGTRSVFSRAYGSALLQPLVGGSGGGGGRGGVTYAAPGGGGGGGAILIASSGTLRVTGTIDATGGDGGGNSGAGTGGQGAGGSGGAIRLVASAVAGAGGLYANGGCINLNGSRRQYCGYSGNGNQYGGSEGRIRIEGESVTFSGTSQPTYTADVPGPIFIAQAPTLSIASVAGQAVPANPTGNADITLPATTTAPVDVVFQTTNVPIGNTVLLRVAPAYGQLTEVLSPAIAGSTASGTATVSVTLPQGPSVLQATTTYTVVVSGMLDLSNFAKNEEVEKVEVTVAMVGEPKARLITVSGKAYDVPYAALRAAGFRS